MSVQLGGPVISERVWSGGQGMVICDRQDKGGATNYGFGGFIDRIQNCFSEEAKEMLLCL